MDLALSISLKPEGADSGDAESMAELDGEEVLHAVVEALALLGEVRVWDTTSLTPAEIASQRRPDLIFNVATGFRGIGREAQAPALFEWLGWPYTGSDPVTLGITLDKWYTKSVLRSAGLPTPAASLVQRPESDHLSGLRFPLLIKPVAEGSGIGIRETSFVETERELLPRVAAHLDIYHQPALVEEFLEGREFTVALIGNAGSWHVLPIVEIDFGKLPALRYPIYGYEAKWECPNPEELICPARVTDSLRLSLEATAVATCEALRVRDWARVDLRLDRDGTPNVLEVNPLPGILPGPLPADISAFTLAAYAAGLDYSGMVRRLVRTALERTGGR